MPVPVLVKRWIVGAVLALVVGTSYSADAIRDVVQSGDTLIGQALAIDPDGFVGPRTAGQSVIVAPCR